MVPSRARGTSDIALLPVGNRLIVLVRDMPPAAGRPRKDDDRVRIGELRRQGKSFGQIAHILSREQGKPVKAHACRMLYQR